MITACYYYCHASCPETLKQKGHNSPQIQQNPIQFSVDLLFQFTHPAITFPLSVPGRRPSASAVVILFRPACPSSLFHTWETLLQEVEIDSQAMGDIGSILGRQVSRPLLEKSFYRKIQSRKVFTHRESYETIIAKTEEKLAKVSRGRSNSLGGQLGTLLAREELY